DVEPAGPGSRVDDDKSVVVDVVGAGDRCGDTGRGLIVRPGEHIGGELAGGRLGGGGDETGGGQGRGTGDRRRARIGGEHERGLKMGCAVGGLRELLTELAEGRMRGAAADEAEGGDVPEHRGSAVSEHHLVAVGQAAQLGRAGAAAADGVLHRSLGGAGAGHRRRGLGQCDDLGGADAGRAGPEASVGGQEFVWDRYLRRSHSRHSSAGGPGPDIGPSYGDRDQPFGGDRAPGPACWPNTRTHAMTRVRAGTQSVNMTEPVDRLPQTRKSYDSGIFDHPDASPLALFRQWYDEAAEYV